ncbi:unnamed protein product, partial [Prunus brigantina]
HYKTKRNLRDTALVSSRLFFASQPSQHSSAFLLGSRGSPLEPPHSVNNPGLSPSRYVVERFSLPTFVGFCLLLAIARVCFFPLFLRVCFPVFWG